MGILRSRCRCPALSVPECDALVGCFFILSERRLLEKMAESCVLNQLSSFFFLFFIFYFSSLKVWVIDSHSSPIYCRWASHKSFLMWNQFSQWVCLLAFFFHSHRRIVVQSSHNFLLKVPPENGPVLSFQELLSINDSHGFEAGF